jgi:hypothetical protein
VSVSGYLRTRVCTCLPSGRRRRRPPWSARIPSTCRRRRRNTFWRGRRGWRPRGRAVYRAHGRRTTFTSFAVGVAFKTFGQGISAFEKSWCRCCPDWLAAKRETDRPPTSASPGANRACARRQRAGSCSSCWRYTARAGQLRPAFPRSYAARRPYREDFWAERTVRSPSCAELPRPRTRLRCLVEGERWAAAPVSSERKLSRSTRAIAAHSAWRDVALIRCPGIP